MPISAVQCRTAHHDALSRLGRCLRNGPDGGGGILSCGAIAVVILYNNNNYYYYYYSSENSTGTYGTQPAEQIRFEPTVQYSYCAPVGLLVVMDLLWLIYDSYWYNMMPSTVSYRYDITLVFSGACALDCTVDTLPSGEPCNLRHQRPNHHHYYHGLYLHASPIPPPHLILPIC